MPRLVCSGVSVYLIFVKCLKEVPVDPGHILNLFKNMPALKMEDSAHLCETEMPSVISLMDVSSHVFQMRGWLTTNSEPLPKVLPGTSGPIYMYFSVCIPTPLPTRKM